MQETREQKPKKLMQAADAVIEAMLDWEAENRAPNLTQIEDEVMALRQRFGQALVSAVVEGQEAQQPATGVKCPQCGEEARFKGEKRKGVESRVGGLDIARGYYYCARCKSGFFPPGQTT